MRKLPPDGYYISWSEESLCSMLNTNILHALSDTISREWSKDMHRYGGAVFLKHARSCLRSNFYLEKANIVFLKYKLIKSHIKGHKKKHTPWQCRHWGRPHMHHRIWQDYCAQIELSKSWLPYEHLRWKWPSSSTKNRRWYFISTKSRGNVYAIHTKKQI
jgi:hypothetical protein